MRTISIICLIAFGAGLVYVSLALPQYMDVNAPANRGTSLSGEPNPSAYYIQNAQRDANTANIVTVILADYRSFDTLGEVVVIFTAGFACLLVLRRQP